MEILPGNKRLVHHANVLLDSSGIGRARDAQAPGLGFPGMDLELASNRFEPDSHFLFWKPGTPALVEPPGMPWRLDPGTDLIFNLHLQPSGRPEPIQPAVGLYFTDTPAARVPMLLQLEHDGALDIPAGDSRFVVTDELQTAGAGEGAGGLSARALPRQDTRGHRPTAGRHDALAHPDPGLGPQLAGRVPARRAHTAAERLGALDALGVQQLAGERAQPSRPTRARARRESRDRRDGAPLDPGAPRAPGRPRAAPGSAHAGAAAQVPGRLRRPGQPGLRPADGGPAR